MIRECQDKDFIRIYQIINESAMAYNGFVPQACYQHPYITEDELLRDMGEMTFLGWEAGGDLIGIMAFETLTDVTLIRHAYIIPHWQSQGIGGRLLRYVLKITGNTRVLVGIWTGAYWAHNFYKKHGFTSVMDKDILLNTYWNISPEQTANATVLGMEMLV